MRILLLIRNMTDIDNDDIYLAITRLQFLRTRMYSSKSICSDERYEFPLQSLIDVLQYEGTDTNKQKEMYRDLNTYISSKYPKDIAAYLVESDLYHPFIDNNNFVMLNFVSGKEIIKYIMEKEKDLKGKYDLIYKVKIGNLMQDGFYDILINGLDGLKNMSVDLDMMFDKIKEDYSNA